MIIKDFMRRKDGSSWYYYYGREVKEISEDSLHIGKTIMIEQLDSCASGVVLSQVNDIFWEALIGSKKTTN